MNKTVLALTISVLSATSSIAQTSKWVYFSTDHSKECDHRTCVNQYLDPSSRKTHGWREKEVTILWNYGEGVQNSVGSVIGRSTVETVIFECDKSKMKFSSRTWYKLANAKGGIVEKEQVNRKWGPIPYNYILLFGRICVGG
jgi:hypothetical protein